MSRISEQTILEKVYDKAYKALSVQGYGFDGVSLQRLTADALAIKVTVSGDLTYIGIAAPGTAEATAKWQCKKVDESGANDTIITWADGDGDFDNASTDMTSLSYS